MGLKISDLIKEIGGEAPTADVTKVASAATDSPDSMEKIAAELTAAGELMADAFVQRTIDGLTKEAAKAPSSHASPGGVTEPSNWSKVKEKLQKMHGSKVSDPDSGHIRAEKVYKHVGGTVANPKN